MLLEIGDGPVEHVRVVLELSESAVAVEAQHAANPSGKVLVVNVLCSALPANSAQAGLRRDQCLYLRRTNTVTTQKMVMPTAPI